MKKTILIIVLLLSKLVLFGQVKSNDTLYYFSTIRAKISYYKSINRFDKAVLLYNNLPQNLKNSITSEIIADLFQKTGDSTFVRTEIKRIYSQEKTRNKIHDLWETNNPYHYVYIENKEFFDSLFLQNEYKYRKNKFLLDAIYEINLCLGADQFYRKIQTKTNDIEMNRQIMKTVDSINTIKLISILKKDTFGSVIAKDFSLLSTLFVHLSRYDTNDFMEIIKYCDKHFDMEILATYKALLVDNRLINNHKEHKYYVYLAKNKINSSLDFEKIDQERKEIGLPSMLFEILSLKLPIPEYYKKEFEKL